MTACLAARFRHFASAECRGASPTYAHLAESIADDPELLALAEHTPPGQPTAPLFFGAVHALLLAERDHPLAGYYASCTAAPKSPEGAFPHFRCFCLERQAELVPLLQERRVQTNEVGRCAYLMPAFARVSALAAGAPLTLVEVGASAGLNLLWDRYAYDYGDGGIHGDPGSDVLIRTELRGRTAPPLPPQLPSIADRIGIDLHVIDIRDPADALWLRALVWPEQTARAARLERALEIARRDPPHLIAGDGTQLLPRLLAGRNGENAVCVFHTHTLNQFSETAREEFRSLLAAASRAGAFYEVSCEWIGTEHPGLELVSWAEGVPHRRTLANCAAHGGWIEWLD